jgi:hypothetical protein
MQLNRFARSLLAAIALLLLLPSLSFAQKDTASLVGNVGDEHGAPLAGAKVTLAGEGTKQAAAQTMGASTDGTGEYRFEGLKPGRYSVTFEAKGLVSRSETIRIKPGHNTTLNVRLKPPLVPKKADNNND